MSSFDNDLKEIIQILNSLIQKASFEVNNKEISEKLAQSLKRSIQVIDTLQKLSGPKIYDNLKSSRLPLKGLGRNLIATGDMTLAKIGTEINGVMKKIEDLTNSRTVVFSHQNTQTTGPQLVATMANPEPALKLQNLFQEIENRHLTKEAELNKRIASLNATLETLEMNVNNKLNEVDKLYIDTGIELETKKTSVNAQLGAITSITMAKDYAQFADTERRAADDLRIYSYFAMGSAFIVALILVCVTKGNLTLTESIIRLSLVLLASAPAAYLTRESAKHRNQENSHRQISLDLIAITPYIASLLPSEQSLLKTQIAMRLFGARNGQATISEGVPINANDLLLKLLDKIDLSSKPDKPPN